MEYSPQINASNFTVNLKRFFIILYKKNYILYFSKDNLYFSKNNLYVFAPSQYANNQPHTKTPKKRILPPILT